MKYVVARTNDTDLIYPKSSIIEIGGSATIHCRSAETPEWTHNEVPMKGNVLKDTLVIDNAKHSDSGFYTCHGTTLEGEQFQDSSILKVFG